MKNRLTLLFTLFGLAVQAQSSFTIDRTLKWEDKPVIHTFSDGTTLQVWRFEGCAFSDDTPTLPVFSERIPLPGRSDLAVTVQSVQYEAFAKKASNDDQALSNELIVNKFVEQERERYWGRIRFIPVRKTGSGYERVTSITLNIRIIPTPPSPVTDRGGPVHTTSALNDGSLYKFGVARTRHLPTRLIVFEKPGG